MLHSISPTPICWQVAPGRGSFHFQTNHPWSDLEKVLTRPLVLADQQRGWRYGYLRKSVI
jgi:hypothetical protein